MSTKKKTTEQMKLEIKNKFPFIEMLGEYTGANNKTLLRCNDCGYEWEAVPRSVVSSKCGCPKCKVTSGKIDNSLKKFLEKYDHSLYELVEFKNCKEVTVKCKKCGFLRTTNANNIYRYGCPKCGQIRGHEVQKLTQEEFIKRAKEVHGDKYDYSKVEYINYSTPVIITCPIHGDFAQDPGHHLRGQGCYKCYITFSDKKEFVDTSIKIHGDKYDYSKVEYINASTPVTIVCPIHGDFQQIPRVHAIIGCGCPKCQQSHGERIVSNILNELNIPFKEQVPLKNPYNEGHKFKLDFWIPSLRTIIEYNGRQHYIPVEQFGGEIAFEKQQKRDEDLRKVCEKAKIHLLEISFEEKDIEKIIKDFINNLPCN